MVYDTFSFISDYQVINSDVNNGTITFHEIVYIRLIYDFIVKTNISVLHHLQCNFLG